MNWDHRFAWLHPCNWLEWLRLKVLTFIFNLIPWILKNIKSTYHFLILHTYLNLNYCICNCTRNCLYSISLPFNIFFLYSTNSFDKRYISWFINTWCDLLYTRTRQEHNQPNLEWTLLFLEVLTELLSSLLLCPYSYLLLSS